MDFIFAYSALLFLCLIGYTISTEFDIGQFLNSPAFLVVFVFLGALVGGSVIFRRPQPRTRHPQKTRAQRNQELDAMLTDTSTNGCYYSPRYGYFDDADNANHISHMAAFSMHSAWNGGWEEYVIDMHGDKVVVHNSDGTGEND